MSIIHDRYKSDWSAGNVTDEQIREIPEALRERIANYQEQRREGQKIMHQLANPPGDEDLLEASPVRMLQTPLTVISFQLLLVIFLLSAIVIELK